MRKIVQHIDESNWRTLDYFRMLDRPNKSQLENKNVTSNISVRIIHITYIRIYVYTRNLIHNLKMTISEIFIKILHNEQSNL